jgi:hypothetical protein
LNYANHKFIKKVFIDEELNEGLMDELINIFSETPYEKFTEKSLNKKISNFIAQKYAEDSSHNNVFIFSLIKLLITGDINTAKVAATCEIIGKPETLKRLKRFKFYKNLLTHDYIQTIRDQKIKYIDV